MSHLLCLGLGYSARLLARRLAGEGWQVTGTSRSPGGVARIEAQGFDALVYNGDAPSPALANAISVATHIVVSAPPESDGDPILRHHAGEFAVATTLRWIGYLSTVGVYGDRAGGWVDETDEPHPETARARHRLTAERQWQQVGERSGAVAQVFRLPGIYGPGRSAIDQLRAGTARRIVKPGQVFNRIHVADIANVLAAAISRGGPAGVFNVADDEPAPGDDVVAHAAGLLGMSPPPAIPFEEAALSEMARSFYAESKRVSNRRMKDVLGVVLAYPTYREGLAAIAAEP